jgi:hypothetical protein
MESIRVVFSLNCENKLQFQAANKRVI